MRRNYKGVWTLNFLFDIAKCLESVEGSFTPDPGAGTVTIEGSGKNFTGSKTVKLK